MEETTGLFCHKRGVILQNKVWTAGTARQPLPTVGAHVPLRRAGVQACGGTDRHVHGGHGRPRGAAQAVERGERLTCSS